MQNYLDDEDNLPALALDPVGWPSESSGAPLVGGLLRTAQRYSYGRGDDDPPTPRLRGALEHPPEGGARDAWVEIDDEPPLRSADKHDDPPLRSVDTHVYPPIRSADTHVGPPARAAEKPRGPPSGGGRESSDGWGARVDRHASAADASSSRETRPAHPPRVGVHPPPSPSAAKPPAAADPPARPPAAADPPARPPATAGRYHQLRSVEKRPQPSGGDDLYVPYKYVVNKEGTAVLIYARGESGRKFFNIRATDWCHLVFDGVSSPESQSSSGELLAVLKRELATESVSYDGELDRYIVEPGRCVTAAVRDYASSSTRVALKSFSLLARYGHRFFDPFDASGAWRSGGAGAAAFRTMVIAQIDAKTVAYTQHGFHGGASSSDEKLTVYISTLHTEISKDVVVRQAASAFPPPQCVGGDGVSVSLDIVVHSSYTSAGQIVDDIVAHAKRAVDIAVHYGVADAAAQDRRGDIAGMILARLREESMLEVFDLRDYVARVYPDMPDHAFATVVREVSVESGTAECDAVASTAVRALYGDALDGCVSEEMLYAEVGNALHTQENAVFFVSRVAARAFLLSMLYFSLSKSIFELAYVSGCNISELTTPEHAARGVMSFVDPISAWSPIVDGLPSDTMGRGMHGLTYVTPLSYMLVDALAASECEFTHAVAGALAPLKAYGWVVRDVFNMQCVRPAPLDVISPRSGAYGLFRNMVYSSVPIFSDADSISRQWSSIINVGLNSWVAINMVSGDDEGVSFGYFGLHDVCRHPFSALRMAVEMYLKMRVCMNNASVTLQSVAETVSLTRESMEMSVRVTANNISHYRKLVSESASARIAHGDAVETLRLWYLTPDSFTTNGIRANRRVYIERICSVLSDAFTETMRGLPSERTRPQPAADSSRSAPAPPPPPLESPVARARRTLDARAHTLREESTARAAARDDDVESPRQINVVLPLTGSRERPSFYPKRRSARH